MCKLSIIIPVYNVEKYLRECLDSISVQTFTDWECLLIDDGSPDNSGAICDEYAAKDIRFKVFHKPNGGVSSARNLGLDKASGEWVTFIDSDDFISPTYLDGLYAPIAKGEQLDLVHGGCTNWKDGKPAGINQMYEDYIGDEPDIVFEKFRGLTVSKLFRLENVNHWSDGLPLRFDEKMKIAEDMAFTMDYLISVKRYAFVSEVGYYYRIDNIGSATHSRKIDTYENHLHSFKHLMKCTTAYVAKHHLTTQQSLLRYNQRAKQLQQTCLSLYYNRISRTVRLAKLRDDFSDMELSLLAFARVGAIKNILFLMLRKKMYILFDLCADFIINTIKRY